jgi:hypothetical protein
MSCTAASQRESRMLRSRPSPQCMQIGSPHTPDQPHAPLTRSAPR